MPEELTLKERLQLIAFAALANGIFFGALFALEWHKVDYKKWFKFFGWTGFVFGVLLYACAPDLKRLRGLLVFFTLLTIHIVLCVVYLRSVSRFPSLFFLFLAPFEAAIGAFVMATVGGVRLRALRDRR